MANRYWVGGTASWDATAGTKWATTSGGAGGASVPTSADDVFFDANSGAVTVTVATNAASCRNLNFTGFTGTFTSSVTTQIYGDVTFVSGMTVGSLSTLAFYGTTNLTSAGKTLGSITVGTSSTNSLSLSDALTAGAITVATGTFTTNNYNVTASSLSSNNSNTRTINLGSSTVTLSAPTPVDFTNGTNLTFNAGTSTISCSGANSQINSSTTGATGQTFYNLTLTNTSLTTPQIYGSNVFNNLTVSGRISAGISSFVLSDNQTINGTLTLSAGTNATMRTFVRSNTIGTTRTLTCAAVASLTDIDFRDIAIAGAAAPVSGTRLGDCKGNSGITFDAAKTVYWSTTSATLQWGNASASGWALTSGGTLTFSAFPLAQDTAVFPSGFPNSGATITINAAYNIGTIDMSARTSNTMTLATGTTNPTIYGNWINGTGTTLTGTTTMTFAGRGSQTITSAGKTFTQIIVIDVLSGSVTLQDALTCDRSNSSVLSVTSGTFNANGYNITLTGALAGVNSSSFNTRTIAVGAGTWTIAGSGTPWNITGSAPVITGTGTISLTSASSKTFAGGGIQTYPTLNQGGTGTLTVTGSNKFKGLTNTAIGRIQFTGGTTNIFDSFTISGALGNLLPLGSTNTTQATLQKTTAWQMGLLSMDSGNNTNLSFLSSDGTMEYLNFSYINGTVVAPPATSTGNFFFFF